MKKAIACLLIVLMMIATSFGFAEVNWGTKTLNEAETAGYSLSMFLGEPMVISVEKGNATDEINSRYIFIGYEALGCELGVAIRISDEQMYFWSLNLSPDNLIKASLVLDEDVPMCSVILYEGNELKDSAVYYKSFSSILPYEEFQNKVNQIFSSLSSGDLNEAANGEDPILACLTGFSWDMTKDEILLNVGNNFFTEVNSEAGTSLVAQLDLFEDTATILIIFGNDGKANMFSAMFSEGKREQYLDALSLAYGTPHKTTMIGALNGKLMDIVDDPDGDCYAWKTGRSLIILDKSSVQYWSLFYHSSSTQKQESFNGTEEQQPPVAQTEPEETNEHSSVGEDVDYNINLALFKSISASAQWPSYPIENVNDGNVNSYWESTGYPAEVTLDLHAPLYVSEACIRLNPDPIWGARTQNIEILSSLDGQEYSRVLDQKEYQYDPATGNQITISFETIEAQYIRLVFTNGSWENGAQAAEILLFGPSGNISLRAENIPAEAQELNGHYYMAYSQSVSWSTAKRNCEEMGGHLVTITSPEEQRFLEQLTKDRGEFWIGLRRVDDDSFVWITGEEITYTNWGDGEPNNYFTFDFDGENSGAMRPDWNDYHEDNTEHISGYICEWDYSNAGPVIEDKPTDNQPEKDSTTTSPQPDTKPEITKEPEFREEATPVPAKNDGTILFRNIPWGVNISQAKELCGVDGYFFTTNDVVLGYEANYLDVYPSMSQTRVPAGHMTVCGVSDVKVSGHTITGMDMFFRYGNTGDIKDPNNAQFCAAKYEFSDIDVSTIYTDLKGKLSSLYGYPKETREDKSGTIYTIIGEGGNEEYKGEKRIAVWEDSLGAKVYLVSMTSDNKNATLTNYIYLVYLEPNYDKHLEETERTVTFDNIQDADTDGL